MSLTINIAVIILEIIGLRISISERKWKIFAYYTQISNVIAVISSAMYIAFRNSRNARLRAVVRGMRYLAACALTMTFIVVMCIFIPFGDTPVMIERMLLHVNGFLHHLVCPVISVVSYVWFEEGVKSRRSLLIPFTATAVYAFTVYALNFLKLAPAPYPFFAVYEHEVPELVAWFFGLMLLVMGIAFVIKWANNKFGDNGKGEMP